ncbi:MAG: HK97-gp10 family putative phage morphogenesis protein [Gemmatimonadota bacterium]
MSKLTVRVKGLEDAERSLVRLRDVFQGRILLAAVQDGADYARDLAEAIAPRAEGAGRRGYHGADNIGTSTRTQKPTRAEVAVGAKPNAFWLNFQELGTLFVPPNPWLSVTFDHGRTHVEMIIGARLRRHVAMVARG